MFKIKFFLLTFFLLVAAHLMISPTLATNIVIEPVLALSEQTEREDELQAVVSALGSVAVGKNIIFGAAHSFNPNPELPVVYSWNFGDRTYNSGEEVVHIFRQPGTHAVTLEMRAGSGKDTVTFPIFVYENVTLLVSDQIEQEGKISALSTLAREQNNLLAVARGFSTTTGFFTEESAIANSLRENLLELTATNLIILWTNGSNGLNGLTRFAQEAKTNLDFGNKKIVVVTSGDLDQLASIASSTFATVQPDQILIVRSDALRDLVLNGLTDTTITMLEEQAIPFRLVESGAGGFQLTKFLSFFVNYLISEGIPASVVLLVLMLPVIATIVSVLKQVVGITTFGVYTPSIVTLSFMAMGLKLGLITLIIVVTTSALVRRMLQSYRLSYTPRMAIVLTATALAILATIVSLLWLAPLGQYTNIAELISASIFPMLIMGTLAERFVSVQAEKGARSAVRLLAEVTFVSVVCYLVVGEWEYFRTLMLATPELVFLFLIFDILLGRFTGLRLTEYFRFRDVIKKAKEE